MSAYRSSGLVLLVAMCVLLSVGRAMATPPSSHFKPGVPDFDQRHPELPAGGNFHCSPTAAANSLTWFDETQGIDVVPGSPPRNEVGLIGTLGTAMKTSGGTWNDDMVKGYRDYLKTNSGGRLWDVKFEGSKYFRGYTIGQNSATVNLDWIKQELADGEDVTLTVDWYRETTPGNFVRTNGAHSITLDGYTTGDGAAGNASTSDLLIRDPWYAEGIVERDPDSVASGRLIYEYNTGSANLRAEIVAAISVSPKPVVVSVNSFYLPYEFKEPVQVTSDGNYLYNSVYSDYVHLGADLCNVIQPYTQGEILLNGPDVGNRFSITFDETHIIDVTRPDGTSLGIEQVEFAAGFRPSEGSPNPHAMTEFWLNRELFGDFPVDSFFDIMYEIDFGGAPQPIGFLGQITLNSQTATSDLTVTDGPVPNEEYPDPPAIMPDPIEESMRLFAIEMIPHIPGDINRDNRVDAADVSIMAANWGKPFPNREMGDLNDDGVIDAGDAKIIAQHWGEFGPMGEAAAVPEPSSLMLLIGLVGMLAVRRRR